MSLQMNDGIIPMTPIQLRIFEKLTSGTSIARKELVKTLKSPRTTIFDNLVKLQNKKINGFPLVMKFSKNTGLRGRPVILWYIPKRILNQINKK